MRNKFENQLKTLHTELIKMGSLCEETIKYAIEALLVNDNINIIKRVYATDDEIDQKTKTIETLCLKMLLQQQPVAKDLRQISSALKMIADMERIGDQASNIAELTQNIAYIDLNPKIQIEDMAKSTINMVTQSINSFVNNDLELVKNVIQSDDIVDEWFRVVKKQLVNSIIQAPESAEICLNVLMVAKYFEKISDHATNIAKWVKFSITGINEGDII